MLVAVLVVVVVVDFVAVVAMVMMAVDGNIVVVWVVIVGCSA